MSHFLNQLRGSGKLHSEGQFTLDVDQAASKLARFQFSDDREFLFQLVGGLFRLGAQSIQVHWKAGLLRIELKGVALNEELPENLPAALLEENSPLRRLAAACQGILVHKLVRFDWLGSEKGQLYDYLAGQGRGWSGVRLAEIQLEGFPTGLVDRALAELEKRAAFCRRPLRVSDRWLPERAPGQKLGGLPALVTCRPGERSQLQLVVDEMCSQAKEVTAPFPWHGVCYGDFCLDASLANVVEDSLYQQVVNDIPQSYAGCIEAVLSNPPREILAPLLSGPPPVWLEPLVGRLRALPLFVDQREKRWSLVELEALSGPIYFTADKAPPDLKAVIVCEKSAVMRACLQAQFPERCQQAGELVLRQLRRQLNQHEWRSRPVIGLQLPQQHWLAQKTYEQTVGQWRLGIPDDWAAPGGSITLLHQGRKLSTRKLFHSEVTFVLFCEIAEAQINEMWDDIAESAWSELEPRWLHCIEELIREMSGERAPEGALRTYLVEHLSRTTRPEDSYFVKTLLFQDSQGAYYSLFDLLALEPGQVLGIYEGAAPEPGPFLPVGVFIQNQAWELRLFQKVRSLKVVELKYLLADLQSARSRARESKPGLELLPEFGQGTVHFTVQGLCLEPVKVDSAVSFTAHVVADDLKFQIQLDNQALGPSRYRLISNKAAKQRLEELVAQARQVKPPTPLTSTWLEWTRQATLRNLCSGAWEQIPCWPSWGHGLKSLRDLRAAEVVNWTTGAGAKEFTGGLLLNRLSATQQKALQGLTPGVQWLNQDAWFAENERMLKFLQKPLWRADFSGVLATQPGFWLLSESGPGRVYWLLHERLEREEEGLVPPCFRALGAEKELLLEGCRKLLGDWLAQPRPRHQHLLDNWREWEKLGDDVRQALQRQPWIRSNRGHHSWDELMQLPALYRLPEGSEADELVLLEGSAPAGLLDRLMSQHPKGHSVGQTQRVFQEQLRLRKQRETLAGQQQRLSGLRYKGTLDEGEIGLSGKSTKDCWLILPDRTVAVHNLPRGLAGFLQSDQYKLRRVAGTEVAELNQALRRRVLAQLVPVLLERIQAGPLKAAEQETVSEILAAGTDGLASARWIPCADGSLTSLTQLRVEAEERRGLQFWPKRYPFCHGGEFVTPILSSPLMIDLVARYCGHRPTLLPPPLLHQPVQMPSFKSAGRLLSAWGQAVENRLRAGADALAVRQAGFRDALLSRLQFSPQAEPRSATAPGPPPSPSGEGKALLTALRRQARSLLQGPARKEIMFYLDHASIGKSRQLWDLSEGLVLSESHLQAYLGAEEPPVAVTLSLLISLVSALNAHSQPFTDEMERKFLATLTTEVVGSWPAKR